MNSISICFCLQQEYKVLKTQRLQFSNDFKVDRENFLINCNKWSVLHATYLTNELNYLLPAHLNMIWAYSVVEMKFVQGTKYECNASLYQSKTLFKAFLFYKFSLIIYLISSYIFEPCYTWRYALWKVYTLFTFTEDSSKLFHINLQIFCCTTDNVKD